MQLPGWLKEWIPKFEAEVIRAGLDEDPAHDLEHIRRVVSQAVRLASTENADIAVVVPAAYLHDIVNIPKNDPRRKQASKLAADAAIQFLTTNGYPQEYFPNIRGAIKSHSYSANIAPKTIEAMCVQDADRLDALGAIGVVRCFTVGTAIRRKFYHPNDPFAKKRELDDLTYTLDHFYVKLFKIVDTLCTQAGRMEGYKRLEFMRSFLQNFSHEIGAEE